jgi:hypothetical protein
MDFDFSTSTVVDSLDKVPEDFRGLYKENDDGKFKLNTEDPSVKSAVSAVVGLNKALKAARGEVATHKSKAVDLSPLSDFGSSVDEISAGVKAKLEELQAQAASTGKAKIDLDKIKQELAAAHAKETEGMTNRNKALQNQLYGLLVETEALQALEGKAINPTLALPFIKQKVQVVEEDGKLQVFVVGEDSTRRYSGVTGQPMTIKELVAEMKASDTYAPLFKSEAPRGAGGNPAAAATKTQIPNPGQSLSSVQKIKAGLDAKSRSR